MRDECAGISPIQASFLSDVQGSRQATEHRDARSRSLVGAKEGSKFVTGDYYARRNLDPITIAFFALSIAYVHLRARKVRGTL